MTIFISYNSRDDDRIPIALKHQIDTKLGDCTFFDRASIKPGDDWKKSIESALNRAQVVILIAGPCFFDDEQMVRLSDDASVIRQELETAHQRQDCTILPIFFDCAPPHRSGRLWPQGMRWLGDLQWVEIRLDCLDSDIAQVAGQIFNLLAGNARAKIKIHAGAVTLISVVESASPEVLRAMLVATGADSLGTANTMRHLELTEQIKNKDIPYDVSDAIKQSGKFSNLSLWLRAVYVLCVAAVRPRERIADIERLDYELRRLSESTPVRAPQSELDSAEVLLMRYLSIVFRRLRERLEQNHLDAPNMLARYFVDIGKLSPAKRQPLDSAIIALNRWGIALHRDDVEPFLGRGRLSDVVRFVKRDPLGKRLVGRRRGGRGRRRRPRQ